VSISFECKLGRGAKAAQGKRNAEHVLSRPALAGMI
jgi:hypothetical protein